MSKCPICRKWHCTTKHKPGTHHKRGQCASRSDTPYRYCVGVTRLGDYRDGRNITVDSSYYERAERGESVPGVSL